MEAGVASWLRQKNTTEVHMTTERIQCSSAERVWVGGWLGDGHGASLANSRRGIAYREIQ